MTQLLENEMHHNLKNILLKLSLTIFLLVVFIGCDSFLPDEFDGDKKFNSPDIDTRASNILVQDTSIHIINSRPLINIVDSLTVVKLEQDSITEDQVILSQFNALVDSLQNTNLLRDSLMFVRFINIGANGTFSVDTTASSIAYAVLDVTPGQPKDFYLYTSLVYTGTNINEYIGVQLIKADGSAVSSSNDMVMETVTSGTQSIPIAGGTQLVPTIKARYHIQVDEGTYLVRFTKSNVSGFGQFFKILILSI